MRKLLFISAIIFLTIQVSGQVIYSDSFDEEVLNLTSSSAYAVELVNNNLKITGNGTAGAYNSMSYSIHSNGATMNIDMSSSPKLFIKAKGQNLPDLRIDLSDNTGYVTNLNAASVKLNDEFQVYELDYTDKLQDGAYGGPCTSGPCAVDSSAIKQLVLFVNAAAGNYEGAIEIEWISIGESLEEIPDEPDYGIRYNQVGYFLGKQKLISINSANDFSGKAYEIYNESDEIVMSGTTGATNFWNEAQEYVATIDVSAIDTEGTYKFSTELIDINFKIADDVYADIAESTFKYFYFNRASTAITQTYGGQYARNSGHLDNEVLVHSSAATAERPTGTIISAPKGWYDAGDYNKYIVNSGISTYTLLAAYEHYSEYYKNRTFNIPETGGNLPDVLDETLWNLDWMMAMQDPNDGGVYHKLTGLNFSGTVMPEDYNLQRYVVQKTTAAALNFAAVMATASRVFAEYESVKPGYSASLLQAAKDAYTWAKANPAIYYSQPNDVYTGQYGDSNVTDEFQWAAIELFITTAENTYKNDINISQINNGIAGWSYTSPLALISIAQHSVSLANDIDIENANNKLISTANTLRNLVENSTMHIAMGQNDYGWGSNGGAGNQIIVLIRAYELTNNDAYLDAAYTAMDYLLGRNGTGYSFVSGFGDKQILNPHHRISEADNVALPVPGMVSGGPNPGQQDSCPGYPNNYRASSFADVYCSYASNEVTINWNAPVMYALNALQYYHEKKIALSVDDQQSIFSKYNLYPNPTSGQLTFQLPINTITGNIEFYNIQGRNVLSKTLKNSTVNIDISTLNSGMYVVKIKTAKNIITKKVIKI